MFKTLRQKFTSGIGSLRRKFGYEAGQETKTRKTRVVSLMSEDEELNLTKRRKAMSAGRDIRRRFAIVAWAARVHCNYVSRFTFQCQIKGNEDFNSYVESLIREQSKRGNFEVTGRHSLNSFMRIAEACRTIDGDIGIMKLSDGRIQAIESDRIQNPKQIDPYISPRKNEKWTHGVRTNDAGAAIEYSIFKRNGKGGYEFERIVPAEHMILHGYFDRFDQVRGIGILTPGTNTFEDVYENYDLALAKTKLSQIFGIKFTTNEGVGPELSDELNEKRQGRASSLKGKAAYMLNLEPGENAEIIEAHTPASEFQQFNMTMIQVALKALDIPYSMFDESFTNFYGSRGGLIQYIESTKPKREDNQAFLDEWTRWTLARHILEGRLTLPGNMTIHELPFRWTAAGIPWWKPGEEAKGYLESVVAGFDSYSGIARMLGKDFREILRERKADEEYAESINIKLPTMGEISVTENM